MRSSWSNWVELGPDVSDPPFPWPSPRTSMLSGIVLRRGRSEARNSILSFRLVLRMADGHEPDPGGVARLSSLSHPRINLEADTGLQRRAPGQECRAPGGLYERHSERPSATASCVQDPVRILVTDPSEDQGRDRPEPRHQRGGSVRGPEDPRVRFTPPRASRPSRRSRAADLPMATGGCRTQRRQQ